MEGPASTQTAFYLYNQEKQMGHNAHIFSKVIGIFPCILIISVASVYLYSFVTHH